MQKHQYDDDKSVQADKENFLKTLSIVKEVLGTEAFATVDYDKKIVLNKFSATFYDSIMIAFSKFDRNKLINNADAIRSAIKDKKLNDDQYHDACYAATGSTERVLRRILIIFNLVSSILGDGGMKKEIRTFDSSLKLPLAEKQGYICPLCNNQIVDINECEIDHIVPYSLGGKTIFENAQLVHKICNRRKSNKT
jgi:5-methylcytosine-specific restriction endonuclease McrA